MSWFVPFVMTGCSLQHLWSLRFGACQKIYLHTYNGTCSFKQKSYRSQQLSIFSWDFPLYSHVRWGFAARRNFLEFLFSDSTRNCRTCWMLLRFVSWSWTVLPNFLITQSSTHHLHNTRFFHSLLHETCKSHTQVLSLSFTQRVDFRGSR